MMKGFLWKALLHSYKGTIRKGLAFILSKVLTGLTTNLATHPFHHDQL